jgi:hypothetical protein
MEPAPNRGRGMDIEHVRVKYNIESCLIRGSMSLKRVALVRGKRLKHQYPHSCSMSLSDYAGLVWPGDSAYQTSGFSRMNFSISALHSSLSNTTTSTPRSLRYFSPPTKVLFSPMTTRFTLYRMHAPVHMSHGERVVYIVAPSYATAGSRPEFWRADISAWMG